MNVLLLSPNFPPNFQRFASALREAGADAAELGRRIIAARVGA